MAPNLLKPLFSLQFADALLTGWRSPTFYVKLGAFQGAAGGLSPSKPRVLSGKAPSFVKTGTFCPSAKSFKGR